MGFESRFHFWMECVLEGIQKRAKQLKQKDSLFSSEASYYQSHLIALLKDKVRRDAKHIKDSWIPNSGYRCRWLRL